MNFKNIIFKEPKLEAKELDRVNRLMQEMIDYVKGMGDYAPAFDNPLIETIAKSIVFAEKAEKWLDVDDVDVANSALDMISKCRAMMRNAVEDLAANRRERLKQKSAAEVRDEVEKFVKKIMGEAEKSGES